MVHEAYKIKGLDILIEFQLSNKTKTISISLKFSYNLDEDSESSLSEIKPNIPFIDISWDCRILLINKKFHAFVNPLYHSLKIYLITSSVTLKYITLTSSFLVARKIPSSEFIYKKYLDRCNQWTDWSQCRVLQWTVYFFTKFTCWVSMLNTSKLWMYELGLCIWIK